MKATHSCKKNGREVGSFFDQNDYFSSSVPGFNIEGTERVGTSLGCMLSVVMWTAFLVYTTYKALVCFTRQNPNISSFEIIDDHDQRHFSFDLND